VFTNSTILQLLSEDIRIPYHQTLEPDNMATYDLHTETSRILQDVLIGSPALNILPSIKEAARKVKFTGGGDGQPFLPTPMKMTESSSALNALVAASASAVATDRYGIDLQDIEVNTDLATLFLESVLLPTINGKPFNSDPKMREELAKMELQIKPVSSAATPLVSIKRRMVVGTSFTAR
jgi:hypothetical protein